MRSTPIEIGQVFGRLKIVSSAPDVPTKSRIGHHKAWVCVCECGNQTIGQSRRLRAGTKRSCGCLQNDTLVKNSIRHGIHHTGGYKAYHEMMKRCYRPNHISYKNYGGRGIKVCERWQALENFIEDMGHPEPGMSLDRRESNGDYSKENCQWSDRKTQNNNRRNVKKYEFNGQSRTLSGWAEATGLPHKTLAARVEDGWPLDEVFTKPVRGSHWVEFDGDRKTIREWSDKLGIKYCTIEARLRRGASAAVALGMDR